MCFEGQSGLLALIGLPLDIGDYGLRHLSGNIVFITTVLVMCRMSILPQIHVCCILTAVSYPVWGLLVPTWVSAFS